jgi:hypothetical protein
LLIKNIWSSFLCMWCERSKIMPRAAAGQAQEIPTPHSAGGNPVKLSLRLAYMETGKSETGNTLAKNG